MEAMRDERGCLTEAGFLALESAPVGKAPPELASHLAGCDRCQQRMLLRGEPRGPKRERPPLGRGLLIAGVLLLVLLGALVAAFLTARRL